MKFEYNPRGVCSRKYTFEIEDNKVQDIEIIGGCNGNLKGIRSLIVGMDIDEIISKLSGIDCGGKGTSCPDQIARALEQFKQQ